MSPFPGIRALLVDNNDTYCECFAHAFRRCAQQGTLERAETAEDATARMENGARPDIVFVDLPVRRGPEAALIERVRAGRKARFPLVVGITASAGTPNTFGCPDALLLKPIGLNDLSAVLCIVEAARRNTC